MLTRIFAALIAALALAAPRAALADDAVAGAIVGAITGAAIATGAVVPYERREPLREYIVRGNFSLRVAAVSLRQTQSPPRFGGLPMSVQMANQVHAAINYENSGAGMFSG